MPHAVAAVVGSLLLAATPIAAQSPVAARVDSIFRPWNRPESPGCAVGVVRNDSMVFARGYGTADLEHGIPITPTTVFDLMSVSKPFTAFAVLLLERQGKVHLDDDIRRYLPEVPVFERPITIAQLLRHTSGLREVFRMEYLAGWRYDDVVSSHDAIDFVKRMRELNHLPGAEESYTNTGYLLLAELIERVSGMSLRDFGSRYMFGPLGMSDTRFRDSHRTLIPRLASSYQRRDSTSYDLVPSSLDFGMFTTVADLARWEGNYASRTVGDSALFLEQEQWTRLTSGDSVSYGAGIRLGTYRGLATRWHSGAGQGFRTIYARIPSARLAVMLLCNASEVDVESLAWRVADVFLPSTLPSNQPIAPSGDSVARMTQAVARAARASAVHLPVSTLATFAGVYAPPGVANGRRVSLRDSILVADRGRVEAELVPLGANTFQMLGVPVVVKMTFIHNAGGDAVVFAPAGQTATRYARVEPAVTTPQAMAEYAGRYYSQELDVTYTLTVRDSTLTLERPRYAPSVLKPLWRDDFLEPYPGADTRFERDPGGRVVGFRITDVEGGVRGLWFARVPRLP